MGFVMFLIIIAIIIYGYYQYTESLKKDENENNKKSNNNSNDEYITFKGMKVNTKTGTVQSSTENQTKTITIKTSEDNKTKTVTIETSDDNKNKNVTIKSTPTNQNKYEPQKRSEYPTSQTIINQNITSSIYEKSSLGENKVIDEVNTSSNNINIIDGQNDINVSRSYDSYVSNIDYYKATDSTFSSYDSKYFSDNSYENTTYKDTFTKDKDGESYVDKYRNSSYDEIAERLKKELGLKDYYDSNDKENK